MFKTLYKILFVLISISFFISATEMDLGECHNTFFDEYDTYVKTEQVALSQSEAEQQVHNTYALIYYAFSCCRCLGSPEETVVYHPRSYYNFYPSKLFLRNSVWRL